MSVHNFNSSSASSFLKNQWQATASQLIDSSFPDKPEVYRFDTRSKPQTAWNGGVAPWSVNDNSRFLSMLWNAWDFHRSNSSSFTQQVASDDATPTKLKHNSDPKIQPDLKGGGRSTTDVVERVDDDVTNVEDKDDDEKSDATPSVSTISKSTCSLLSRGEREEECGTISSSTSSTSQEDLTSVSLQSSKTLTSFSDSSVKSVSISVSVSNTSSNDSYASSVNHSESNDGKGERDCETAESMERKRTEEKRRKKEEKALAFAIAKKGRKEEKERRRIEELQRQKEEEERARKEELEAQKRREEEEEAEKLKKAAAEAARDLELELLANANQEVHGEGGSSLAMVAHIQRHSKMVYHKTVREKGIEIFIPSPTEKVKMKLNRQLECALREHEDRTKGRINPLNTQEWQVEKERRKIEWKKVTQRLNLNVPILRCSRCSKMGHDVKILVCKSCLGRGYCSRECQVADWKRHKLGCGESKRAKENGMGDLTEWSLLFDTLLQKVAALALKVYTPHPLNLTHGLVLTLVPAVPLYRIGDTPLPERYKVGRVSVEPIVPLISPFLPVDGIRQALLNSQCLIRGGEAGYSFWRIRILKDEGESPLAEKVEPVLMFKVKREQVVGRDESSWMEWLKKGVKEREIERLDMAFDFFNVNPPLEPWRNTICDHLWKEVEMNLDVVEIDENVP